MISSTGAFPLPFSLLNDGVRTAVVSKEWNSASLESEAFLSSRSTLVEARSVASKSSTECGERSDDDFEGLRDLWDGAKEILCSCWGGAGSAAASIR